MPNSSKVLGLGVAVKAKVEILGELARFAELFQDRLVDLLLGGLGAGPHRCLCLFEARFVERSARRGPP